jgi:hypothetical protein
MQPNWRDVDRTHVSGDAIAIRGDKLDFSSSGSGSVHAGGLASGFGAASVRATWGGGGGDDDSRELHPARHTIKTARTP